MPAAPVAEVRQRVAAVLSAPARESTEPYLFLRAATHTPVHMEFAVGVPDTAPILASGGRQRPSEGQASDTRVMVGMWYQLTVADRVVSFDACLAAEAAIRNALVAKGWQSDFSLIWLGSTRSAGSDGWVFLDQTFQAIHLLPMS